MSNNIYFILFYLCARREGGKKGHTTRKVVAGTLAAEVTLVARLALEGVRG